MVCLVPGDRAYHRDQPDRVPGAPQAVAELLSLAR
jgi:hypothetical protein